MCIRVLLTLLLYLVCTTCTSTSSTVNVYMYFKKFVVGLLIMYNIYIIYDYD